MRFPLSDDAQVELARWSPKSRALFEELVEDAATDLQRELLARAVASGHSPSEVHAFGDQIRSLSDPELFSACTMRESGTRDFTVAQLLRAEADPLFAFELNGGVLEPKEEPARPPRSSPPPVDLASSSPLSLPMGARRASFDSQGSGTRRAPPVPGLSPSGAFLAPLGAGGEAYAEALLSEATRGLGVSWRETDLDTRGGVAVGDALAVAATALARGIPVPCIMGPGVGQHRRFVLLLQTNAAGASRAWQLYDPISRELVWANETDLVSANELPFANKVNRRLTRIVLPRTPRPAA